MDDVEFRRRVEVLKSMSNEGTLTKEQHDSAFEKLFSAWNSGQQKSLSPAVFRPSPSLSQV